MGKGLKITAVTLVLLATLIVVFGVLFLGSVNKDKYTEEEHLERIAKRIQALYIDGDDMINLRTKEDEIIVDADANFQSRFKATGFKLYPLYNENDELLHALVEFEPYGFVYVKIKDGGIIPSFSLWGSMYARSLPNNEAPWSPCYLDECGEIVYETDESGNKILYVHSPYFVRGVTDEEKRYFIHYNHPDDSIAGYFPAVKRNGKFVNLYSLDEFEVIDGRVTTQQAIDNAVHFYPPLSDI